MRPFLKAYCFPSGLFLYLLVTSALFSGAPNEVQGAGKQMAVTAVTRSDRNGEEPWRYLLFRPQGYDESAEEKWPLLLYLHGRSGRGNDLEKIKRYGPPSFVEQRKDFPFFTVSPQLRAGSWDPDALSLLLDELLATYQIDPDRVYVSGVSLGAMGAWTFVGAVPDRIAALVPICAHGPPGVADVLTKVPIRAFHGAKDKIVPIAPHRQLIEAIQTRGGNARLTVYPDGDHGSVISPTYENPELIRWLLDQEREKNPTTANKSDCP